MAVAMLHNITGFESALLPPKFKSARTILCQNIDSVERIQAKDFLVL